MKACAIQRESSFCGYAPGANRGVPETSPLVVRFPVVVPAFSYRSKHSGSDRVAHLLRSASVVGRRLRVQSDVIDVGLPPANDGRRTRQIASPHALRMIRHIVEKPEIVLDGFQCK